MPYLIGLFIGLPLIEIAILVKLGDVFGFWPTIWLVGITGILGATLARSQGIAALTRIQAEVAAGRIPAEELIDGVLILLGGIVLLTPGLLTDLFGFSMMIPAVRVMLKDMLRKRFHTYTDKDTFRGGGMVIDAEDIKDNDA